MGGEDCLLGCMRALLIHLGPGGLYTSAGHDDEILCSLSAARQLDGTSLYWIAGGATASGRMLKHCAHSCRVWAGPSYRLAVEEGPDLSAGCAFMQPTFFSVEKRVVCGVPCPSAQRSNMTGGVQARGSGASIAAMMMSQCSSRQHRKHRQTAGSASGVRSSVRLERDGSVSPLSV